MRKALIFIFAFIFIFTVPVIPKASNGYESIYPSGNILKTPYDLFQYWEKHGYPDYVCGVWSTNGGTEELTFGITDGYDHNGNKGKDVILLNVKDYYKITFVYQKYSKNYLLEIMDELNVYFEKSKELGFTSMAIYDNENCVKLGIRKDKENDPKTNEFINEIKSKYGDAISVEFTEEIIEYTMLINSDNTYTTPKTHILYIVVLCSFIIVTALGVSILKTKKAVLSNGEIADEYKYSKKEIENKIKNSTFSPSSSLDKKIMDEISKK